MPCWLRWCASRRRSLGSALDRLIAAGLLFRQGVPPHATYLFKHALVQDAAYGTLLREPRRALHARIAETLESQFAEIAENQPELLARHCTEAGLIEKAAGLWGKAGQRSLERSALVEAAEQLTRALDQIATLPATPALRREAIKLQVAFATVLFHVKGYTSPQTIAAFERADAMIEQSEALGERSDGEDALLRFSVLYGQWTGNHSAGNFAKAARGSKAVPCGGGKAAALCTIANGSPSDGSDPLSFRESFGLPVAPGSSGCSLQTGGTQTTGGEIWSGYRRRRIGLSVTRPVPPRLPRKRARRWGRGIEGRTRPRPSRYPLICRRRGRFF